MCSYVLGDEQLSSILDELLPDLLDLVGPNVIKPNEDDLVVLVEELKTLLDGDLLLVPGLN